MLKLNTLRFGEIDVEEDKIVTFEQGIPGFEASRRFIVLHPDESLPFAFMQSIEDGDLAFIVTNPFYYFPEYQFELPDSVQEALNIENESDVTLCSVVTVGGGEDIYLNLLAPIVMNTRLKKGRQVILHQSEYKTKHRIPLQGSNDQQTVEGE
jgi:flagellar assembly factor FliW